MSSFRLANNYTTHLVVQPADLRLNPPESYLIVQDALIVSCGVLYALCYLFYMTRTYKDKRCAGPIEYTYEVSTSPCLHPLTVKIAAAPWPTRSSTPSPRRPRRLND